MQPFDGIRVLDLTHVLAGPFATFQLAALGADVIKIEPPGRPDMTRDDGVVPEWNKDLRGSYYQAQAAGKRSVVLDLGTEAGRAVFLRLVDGADVLVQNYAGAALDRFGLGPEEICARNPRLIYCSMSGFGRTGPKAEHPAYDVVIQAYSGIMAANGWTAGDPPLRVGPPMVDYGTGAQAAVAISAALLQRERTGRGQVIDVAMADAAFLLMSAHVTEALAVGHAPTPFGNRHPKKPGYSAYRAADGWVMFGAWTDAQAKRFFETLGLAGIGEAFLAADAAARKDLVADCEAAVEAVVAERSAAHWEDVMNAAHVPAARVRRIEETLAEPQLASRGVLGAVPDQWDGPDSLPLAGFTYAHGGPAFSRPPPGYGQHTDEVLGELGLSEAEIAGLRADKVIG